MIERVTGEHTVRGFPALVDEGRPSSVRVFATEAEQAAAMPRGVRRLVRLAVPSPVKAAERSLSARARLVLGANPDGAIPALLDDCADAAVDALSDTIPWDAAIRESASGYAPDWSSARSTSSQGSRRCSPRRTRSARAAGRPAGRHSARRSRTSSDQFRRLLPVGFVAAAGVARLADLTRYLTAIARRLERLPRDVDIDRARMARVHAVQAAYDDLVRALPAVRAGASDVRAIGWQLEELRVSLWAQQLGTPRPVSEQRIYRAIDAITP